MGAKSGTAQIAAPGGGYLPNVYDGTYIGFIEGAGGVKYVMMVRLDQTGRNRSEHLCQRTGGQSLDPDGKKFIK